MCNFNDLNLGRFEADVCRKCGEKIFTEKASDQIDKKAEELKILGPKMKPPEMLYI